ncbi:MAG: hypothetical protein ABIE92_15470 [bacterium]
MIQVRLTSLLLLLIIILSLSASKLSAIESENDSSFSQTERPAALTLDDFDLGDFDFEETADWITLMPGAYPLDAGEFHQPFRVLYLGLSPKVTTYNYRGRVISDPLLGSPETAILPPNALSQLKYDAFSLEGSGPHVTATLRDLSPTPPTSRIAHRDGFYGMSYVDFGLSQMVTPSWRLNGGGRIANFSGRIGNTEAYGLNLRAEVVWWDSTYAKADSSGLWGWWGIMQNERKSGVPYQTYDHSTKRYETDAVLFWKKNKLHLYGLQQVETFHNNEDGWEELGLLLSRDFITEGKGINLEVRANLARWKLSNTDWASTSAGGGTVQGFHYFGGLLRLDGPLGIDLSDDFDPSRHLGIKASKKLINSLTGFLSAAQHQYFPSRFETDAFFESGEHYYPYHHTFYQNPDLTVDGSRDLKNETITSVQAGIDLQVDHIRGQLGVIHFNVAEPLNWVVEDGFIKSVNGDSEENSGLIGWLRYNLIPEVEFGVTGSYLPLSDNQKRITPEISAHTWLQYKLLLFNDHLDLRFRLWLDVWGERYLPIPGGWESAPLDLVTSGRINARIYNFQIYYNLINMFDLRYELLPGYPMMHKEEVLGISWTFTN